MPAEAGTQSLPPAFARGRLWHEQGASAQTIALDPRLRARACTYCGYLERKRKWPLPLRPWGAERVGVRWGLPGRRPPTSPSHAGACPRAALCADPWGVGPFLSPLKRGEGFLTGPDACMP